MGTAWAIHGEYMGITWANAHAVPIYVPFNARLGSMHYCPR